MKKFRNLDLGSQVLFAFAGFILALFAILLGNQLFNGFTLQSMGFQIAEFMFLALGMAIVMLTGGIDLSIVANMNLCAVIVAFILSGSVEGNSLGLIVIAVVCAIAAGSLLGFVNGRIISQFGVNPIVATLGSQLLFLGVASGITNGASVGVKVASFSELGTFTLLGVPFIFLLGCIGYLICAFYLSKTSRGQRIYYYGTSPTAALFSGQRVGNTVVGAYVISGLMAAFAGIIMVARVNSARVGFGETYLLQALLVVVLAGFHPFGGRGKISNLLVGVMILQVLQSGFTIMNFSPFAKNLVWGGTLIFVVCVERALSARRKSNRKSKKSSSKMTSKS
ncbi:ABC transporter permease [Schaalia turicensis]|uniref:ABC transporter permease n=1 Tax=Schaalia turicensis TaxID=131111 RepID=UPI003681F580